MLRRADSVRHSAFNTSRGAVAVLLATLALMLFALPAHAADGGTIQGKVVNGTSIGLSRAALLLANHREPLMVVGNAANLVGIVVMLGPIRGLHRSSWVACGSSG